MSVAGEAGDDGFGPDIHVGPSPAVEPDAPTSFGLTVPLLLAAGWGALLTFSVMFLMDDGRSAVAATDRMAAADAKLFERAAEARARAQEAARAAAAEPADAALPTVVKVASASADTLPPLSPAAPAPASPPIERVSYVGTWGPTAQACGIRSRRRGYLPAVITEDGAKAGRTLCRFRNGKRDGIAWTLAADCSERGRNWTSQVRLLVDGDRLIWTSAKGSSSYVRCGRRDG